MMLQKQIHEHIWRGIRVEDMGIAFCFQILLGFIIEFIFYKIILKYLI